MSNEENNVEEVAGAEKKPFSIISFLEDNSRRLTYAGIALLVVATGIWYYTSKYLPQREATANNELYQAFNLFGQDSFDLALNGTVENSGLLDVIDEYGNTSAADKANLMAARAYMEKGEYEEAISYLEDASFDDEVVAPLAVCLLGDCYVELDETEEGASYYMKAANMRDNTFTTPYSLGKASRAYAELGDWENALEALQRIKDDYSETQFAALIDKQIARAEAASK